MQIEHEHPCGLVYMQANVAASESPLAQRRTLCICSQPDSAVWCQITRILKDSARAGPRPTVAV
jgi:hypothetical protein